MSGASVENKIIQAALVFFTKKFKENRGEFFHLSALCKEFVEQNESCTLSVTSLEKKLREYLNNPEVECPMRVNVIYHTKMAVGEELMERLEKEGSAKFNEFFRLTEYNDKKIRLGEPLPYYIFEFLACLASKSLKTRSHQNLFKKYENRRLPKVHSPYDKKYLSERVREVYQVDIKNVEKYNFDAKSQVMVMMMTGTKIFEDQDGLLLRMLSKVGTFQIKDRKITEFTFKDQSLHLKKDHSSRNGLSKITESEPQKVKHQNKPADQDPAPKIDSGLMNYLNSLKPHCSNTTWSKKELTSLVMKKENLKRKSAEKKVQQYNQSISTCSRLTDLMKIKMLFSTYTPISQEFLEEIKDYGTISLDSEMHIIKFIPTSDDCGETSIREAKEIQDMNPYTDINCTPWSVSEVNSLLNFIHSTVINNTQGISLREICREFKTLKRSQHTIKKLVAKAKQYLQFPIPDGFGLDDHKKLKVLLQLRLEMSPNLLEKYESNSSYELNESRSLVFSNQLNFCIGQRDENLPNNLTAVQSSLLRLLISYSTSTVTCEEDAYIAKKIKGEPFLKGLTESEIIAELLFVKKFVESCDGVDHFSKLHTLFVTQTPISCEFEEALKRDRQYKIKLNPLSLKIIGYSANWASLNFDQTKLCTVEKEEVAREDVVLKKSNGSRRNQLTGLPKQIVVFLEWLINNSIQKWTKGELHKAFENLNEAIPKNVFMQELNEILRTIERFDYFDLFTSLRILSQTKTPVSEEFKQTVIGYNVVLDDRDVITRFKANVKLSMSLDFGPKFEEYESPSIVPSTSNLPVTSSTQNVYMVETNDADEEEEFGQVTNGQVAYEEYQDEENLEQNVPSTSGANHPVYGFKFDDREPADYEGNDAIEYEAEEEEQSGTFSATSNAPGFIGNSLESENDEEINGATEEAHREPVEYGTGDRESVDTTDMDGNMERTEPDRLMEEFIDDDDDMQDEEDEMMYGDQEHHDEVGHENDDVSYFPPIEEAAAHERLGEHHEEIEEEQEYDESGVASSTSEAPEPNENVEDFDNGVGIDDPIEEPENRPEEQINENEEDEEELEGEEDEEEQEEQYDEPEVASSDSGTPEPIGNVREIDNGLGIDDPVEEPTNRPEDQIDGIEAYEVNQEELEGEGEGEEKEDEGEEEGEEKEEQASEFIQNIAEYENDVEMDETSRINEVEAAPVHDEVEESASAQPENHRAIPTDSSTLKRPHTSDEDSMAKKMRTDAPSTPSSSRGSAGHPLSPRTLMGNLHQEFLELNNEDLRDVIQIMQRRIGTIPDSEWAPMNIVEVLKESYTRLMKMDPGFDKNKRLMPTVLKPIISLFKNMETWFPDDARKRIMRMEGMPKFFARIYTTSLKEAVCYMLCTFSRRPGSPIVCQRCNPM